MIDKPKRFPNIVSEHHDEEERDVHEIAVDILHDQRKRTLAEISFPGLADGAGWRVRPERFVIRASIIIAGQPKSARRPQNQERRRIVDPTRPPAWRAFDPGVGRVAENLRRIKRRDVIAKKIISSLKGGPRRINDESAEADEYEQRLDPPGVAPHRFAKRTRRQSCTRRAVHCPSAPSIGSLAFFHASPLPATFQRFSKPFSFKMLAAILAR